MRCIRKFTSGADATRIKELHSKFVIPTYARFDLVWSHGKGPYIWDTTGKRYIDMGAGIAVNALGHANPELIDAMTTQASKYFHVSNLYFDKGQGELAENISKRIAPGKVFFCNSGAEANEGQYKLARMFGTKTSGKPGAKYEVITAVNSFHGRTLAGIAATGQDKVKVGFFPMVEGFKYVPYNDLAAVAKSITPATAAILIEGIQGEGGIMPATPEYLLGLRKLCDEKNILLMMDGVQCGYYRTGSFHSFQRILPDNAKGFVPDAISMAKSIAGGFPMGAFWVREKYQDLLSAGTHGTTYGGNPIGCAIANKVLEVIDRDNLGKNVLTLGEHLKKELNAISKKYPSVIKSVRGHGFMLGLEIDKSVQKKGDTRSPAGIFIAGLHDLGVLGIGSGDYIVRLLPPLNLSADVAKEALDLIATNAKNIAAK